MTKSFEVSSRSEKGLHDLKGWALIMFVKKFIHETVEKFFAMTPSKDWGKGVGSAGAVEGTVGTAEEVGSEDEVGAGDEVVVVGC